MLKNPSTVFKLDEDMIVIQPNNSQFIRVDVLPLIECIYTDVLYLSIKDNPKIEQINLMATACTVKVEIQPNNVRFNRMVIDATKTMEVILTNYSYITIFWKFNDVGNALKYFIISKLCGYVKPMCEDVIRFTLTPKIVVDIGPFLLDVMVRDLIKIRRLI